MSFIATSNRKTSSSVSTTRSRSLILAGLFTQTTGKKKKFALFFKRNIFSF